MKEVQKKSADPAVNHMLVQAFKQGIDLSWDRAEAMQPQCGFGRLGICCTDCQEGPCRVSPFGNEEEAAVCGRNRQDLVVSSFLKKTREGTAALLRLAADFGADVAKEAIAIAEGDNMFSSELAFERLGAYSSAAAVALNAIGQAHEKDSNSVNAGTIQVNFGVLEKNKANVILYGHVPPKTVEALSQAANTANVSISAVCGSEGGLLEIPAITNYDSQELPLLTGAVDMVVIGRQCVMPAVPKLAEKLGIPVQYVNDVTDTAVEQIIEQAQSHWDKRAGKPVDIPQVKATAYARQSVQNSSALLQTIAKAYAQDKIAGLVYLGGCGNVGNTQDAQIIKLANDLIGQGYVIVTAGCAGISLAKAGLCTPDNHVLGEDIPAVNYLGSCQDIAQFLIMAKNAKINGVPVYALMPEITHNKMFAAAIAFANQGIATFIGVDWLAVDEQAAQIVNQYFTAKTGGSLLNFKDFPQVSQRLAEIAAAK